MALFRVAALPDEATAASARFHGEILPEVLAELANTAEHFTLVFEPADHTHRGWRLAVVEGLARRFAPIRVNALEASDEAAVAAAACYCAEAAGVTGQLVPLDSNGAGEVLYTDK